MGERRPPRKKPRRDRPRESAPPSQKRPAEAGRGYLVVVGASAGGIEALSVLVSSLKQGFPAPVVIAQHLDPNRASHLGSILERRGPLPVMLVSNRMALEPGHVYVVPSNRHVAIHDGHVVVESDHGDRPRPSVDLLLSTAAQAYGDRLIAVVLTGSGSDGAAGAVDVKDAGGVVIIQNPQTAAYPSMPMALPPTAVDYVAELDAIGPMLHDLVTGTDLPEALPPGEPNTLAAILALLGRHAAIDFRPYKPTTILRRIARRMAVTHTRALPEYYDFLQSHPHEMAELVMALLIKVTEFFRDPEAFTYLRREVLPALFARGRDQGRVLRVWSAGCATGEEAYSLALLIADQLGGELNEWSVKVFATDVDEAAINFARRGFYPANVLRNLPEELVARYFEPSDQGFRVSKLLRQMVIFGQQDLTRGVPFPRIDLVVCRNLLIYFKPELQEEVLDIFAYSLHQMKGYLFLGKAETARPSRSVYDLVDKKWKVYRCLKGPLPAALRQGPMPGVASPRAQRTSADHRLVAIEDPQGGELELAQVRRYNELLLRAVPAGVILVDRQYRIVSINPAARRLLGVRDSATDQDFLHTVRGLPYEELRAAIDRAGRERATVTLEEVPLAGSAAAEPRFLTLQAGPLPAEGTALEYVLVSVLDVTVRVQSERRLDALQNEQRQLSEELGATNRRLSETNKELLDANEELQAANEELMLAQEELQATNEEFEATNEELQATNEELETNNEELQATNEELETTNEELQARTGELQELNRVLTTERLRLAEMVELAPFYITVLRGPALLVENLNPTSSRLFGGHDALGRPFEEVCRNPSLEPLLVGVREVYRRDRAWSSGRLVTHIPGRQDKAEERDLVYSVVPSHNEAGRVDGVVIYAEDVTEKRAREDEQRLAMLKVMVEHAHPVALALFDATTGDLLQGSPRYLEIIQAASGRRDARAVFARVSLLPEAAQAETLLRQARENGEPVRIPELKTPEDGVATVWDWNLIPIRSGEDGPRPSAVRYVLVVAFDVTDQVRLREELRGLDKVKDEFLAMASHELRTPLVPLTAYADLMEKTLQEAKGPDQRWAKEAGGLLVRFRKQIADLTRLTDDLLDVGRLQSGSFAMERRPVDLMKVVEEAREMGSRLADAPAIRLEAERDGVLAVNGDEGRLVQAVSNLVANAVRYGRDGGAIDLRLGRLGSDRARIEVQDYGPGIATEDQAKLFTRFYRGPVEKRPARSGLGLGLFICKHIVERHGGTVSLDSRRGKGASFTIELPLQGHEPPSGDGGPPRRKHEARRARGSRKPGRARRR